MTSDRLNIVTALVGLWWI